MIMKQETQGNNVQDAKKSVSQPRLLLGVEGVALFAAAVGAYFYLGYSGWILLLLILAPDLAMLGYLANKQIGATAYNIVHSTTLPIILLALGWLAGIPYLIPAGLILLAHIGMDRTVGYGLKYADDFKHTHLQEV